MMNESEYPPADQMDIGKVMSALADPLRRQVVTELLELPPGGERSCKSFNLPIAKSSQTFLFRTLRQAGLTYDENYGNRRGVSLRRDDLNERFPGLIALLEHEARERGDS
jgi:DNA-binding transcriptional ArsR family regulator